MFSSVVKFLALSLCLHNYFYVTDAQVQMSVLYETLCPDSIRFITTQLYDTYSKIGSNYINLEMVPYGRVKDVEVNGTTTKSCQHGPQECYGNKVHGCALEQNSISDSLGFIYCSESSSSPASNSTLEQCAKSNKISWTKVESCLESGEAETIFEKNGEKTNNINPTFIPYIVFNGVVNETLQNGALLNSTGVICSLLDKSDSNKPLVC